VVSARALEYQHCRRIREESKARVGAIFGREDFAFSPEWSARKIVLTLLADQHLLAGGISGLGRFLGRHHSANAAARYPKIIPTLELVYTWLLFVRRVRG
jgi:hypothetical protein